MTESYHVSYERQRLPRTGATRTPQFPPHRTVGRRPLAWV